MFYGRQHELQVLAKWYAEDRFQFIPIYGRRRVGKTSLIKRFIEDKPAVYFRAVAGSLQTNLRLLTAAVFGRSLSAPLQFDELLEEIGKRAAGQRLVFVIDEYPLLVKDHEELGGLLNNFIEDHRADSRLFVIVCGSSLSIMEHQVLGRKSPLYGRRTGQLRVRPFRFCETGEILAGFSDEDRAAIYGLVGGIPLYLEQFRPTESLRENLVRNLLPPEALMAGEPGLLFLTDFSAPEPYYEIMSALAKGHTRLSAVADACGVPPQNVMKLIKNLCLLGYVERLTPFGQTEGRQTVYRIADPLLRTYYRFIYPECVETAGAELERAADDLMAGLDSYLGGTFEGVCREYLLQGHGAVGPWWGPNAALKRTEEIDAVAARGEDRIFAECKYRHEPTGPEVLHDLIRKSQLVPCAGDRRYVIFSRAGFTPALEQLAAGLGVRLIGLRDLCAESPGELTFDPDGTD